MHGLIARSSFNDTIHRHSGIALMTPQTVHYGHAQRLTAQRSVTLEAAFVAHPQRFKGVTPKPPRVRDAA
jgi:putative transposase